MSIMANYLVFMTFFPASLALVLEVREAHITQVILAPSATASIICCVSSIYCNSNNSCGGGLETWIALFTISF